MTGPRFIKKPVSPFHLPLPGAADVKRWAQKDVKRSVKRSKHLETLDLECGVSGMQRRETVFGQKDVKRSVKRSFPRLYPVQTGCERSLSARERSLSGRTHHA